MMAAPGWSISYDCGWPDAPRSCEREALGPRDPLPVVSVGALWRPAKLLPLNAGGELVRCGGDTEYPEG